MDQEAYVQDFFPEMASTKSTTHRLDTLNGPRIVISCGIIESVRTISKIVVHSVFLAIKILS